jgi:hypothetical protein
MRSVGWGSAQLAVSARYCLLHALIVGGLGVSREERPIAMDRAISPSRFNGVVAVGAETVDIDGQNETGTSAWKGHGRIGCLYLDTSLLEAGLGLGRSGQWAGVLWLWFDGWSIFNILRACIWAGIIWVLLASRRYIAWVMGRTERGLIFVCLGGMVYLYSFPC